jgi:1-pyrroline-5-carboxylate dehydrogenase
MLGALFMGNKLLLKTDSKISICVEEFLRFIHACGMPKNDCILVHTNGENMESIIKQVKPRMTLFTGSGKVANKLSSLLEGRIKVEDAGFDWKILGPDVSDIDYVSYVSDQDAYALSGQKCSAQSIVFAHENWVKAGFFDKIKERAEKRSLKSLTISPVMTWTNEQIQNHIDNLLKIPGTKVLFGGEPVKEKHNIPKCYGSYKPTAVYVPLKEFNNTDNFKTITKEVFGPVQIVTEYNDKSLDNIIEYVNSLNAYLTAGVVSNCPRFLNKVLGKSVNGVTYAGIRARTTGAPQNHWFGPCGDPRAGGIGTIEAIKYVWSSHREIVYDTGYAEATDNLIQS